MRLQIILAALLLGATAPAFAAGHPAPRKEPAAAGPTAIGTFGDWTAARYVNGGQTICYAFTRAKSTHPAEPGAAPLLTVTERASSRDEVAITAQADYPKGASVTVQVDQTGLDFYTSGSDAFAREGGAAVAAFRVGAQAIARGPAGHVDHAIDTFSLSGFTAAYDAIVKSCPASR